MRKHVCHVVPLKGMKSHATLGTLPCPRGLLALTTAPNTWDFCLNGNERSGGGKRKGGRKGNPDLRKGACPRNGVLRCLA